MAWILVVDDEYVLVEMVASLIEDLGFRPAMAANGEEALQQLLVASEQPGLVISDIMMPRMNGLELATAVKHNPRLHDVPVVLMSAAGKPPDVSIADEFIHKPFDMDELAGLIERYMQDSE